MNYSQKTYQPSEKLQAIRECSEKYTYSTRYSDEEWEYRHVILPKKMLRFIPPGIMTEEVWRGLGIRQSPGWELYMRHDPEPNVLLFRRLKDYDLKHPPLHATTRTNVQRQLAVKQR